MGRRNKVYIISFFFNVWQANLVRLLVSVDYYLLPSETKHAIFFMMSKNINLHLFFIFFMNEVLKCYETTGYALATIVEHFEFAWIKINMAMDKRCK